MYKSVEQFQRAIEIDPKYAPAYAELGNAYVMLAQPLGGLMPKDGEPKAKAAALKALQIDDNLARAHAVLGSVETFYDWDWAAAEKEFKLREPAVIRLSDTCPMREDRSDPNHQCEVMAVADSNGYPCERRAQQEYMIAEPLYAT